MDKINTSLIKDIIISLLIVICIVLIFSVIFYDDISVSKVIPESQEYELTEEMQQELEETYYDEATEVVVTYSMDSSDLKRYEKVKEYNSGKQNPFAEESIEADNSNTGDTDSEDTNESTNFYEDDGTK